MLEIELLARFRFYITCSIIFFSGLLFAQTHPIAKVDSLLKTGISCILNQEYSKASSIFMTLESDYPNLPLGKIYLAAVSISKSFDLAEEYDAYTIINNLSIAKDMAEKLIENDEGNIWYHYYYALAVGYQAYYNALSENWVTAFSNGLSAVNEFNTCLDMDKNFYDALIASGAYKYWRSRKTENFNWLPFISDEREIGISYLELAIAKTSYNTYLAELSLMWIYIDKSEYKLAIAIGERLYKNYPDSRISKWALARAYENVDTLKAIGLYNQILTSYGDLTKTNHINEIVIKHKIAQQYYKLKNYSQALRYCNDILSIKKLSKYASEKLKSRLEKVKELSETIHKIQ